MLNSPLNPIMKIIEGSLVKLPSPSSISYLWNFGSLLGLILGAQIVSGLFLSMHYAADVSVAFDTVSHIMRDVNFGWSLRIMHANGASFFFLCLYIHVARGLYYTSYYFFHTWMVGVSILLAVMATAFLGYVLPWGQMSFWGATVITNLFSAIPIIGPEVVCWLWGGFAVDNATLSRFYSLHFLLPFVVLALVIMHLMFLHQSGSSNPLGLSLNVDKIIFSPYFTTKDLLGMFGLFISYGGICFYAPWMLGDPENFIPANPLVTPLHIQPEWYFLFAYAILRSIPNKLGGVIALLISVVILYTLPFFPVYKMKSNFYNPYLKLSFWGFVNTVILLTWIGARPVEEPYVFIGQALTVVYFLFYFLHFLIFNYTIKI